MGPKRRSEADGFTLIELLISLAILAILAVVVVPTAQVIQQREREVELRRSLNQIRDAIDAYKDASDQGRIRHDLGATGYPPDLQVLVDGVEDQRDPTRKKLFFLRRIPSDPFSPNDNDSPEDSWGLRSYASDAASPEPGEDVYDIHSRSERIGLNGVPYTKW